MDTIKALEMEVIKAWQMIPKAKDKKQARDAYTKAMTTLKIQRLIQTK